MTPDARRRPPREGAPLEDHRHHDDTAEDTGHDPLWCAFMFARLSHRVVELERRLATIDKRRKPPPASTWWTDR